MPRDNDHDIYVPGHYTTTTNAPDNWAPYTWVQVEDPPTENPRPRADYTVADEAPAVDFDGLLRRLEELYRKNYIQPLYPEGTPIDDETGLPL